MTLSKTCAIIVTSMKKLYSSMNKMLINCCLNLKKLLYCEILAIGLNNETGSFISLSTLLLHEWNIVFVLLVSTIGKNTKYILQDKRPYKNLSLVFFKYTSYLIKIP